ncbi:DUF3772 domain-containing protein [Pseudooceanicola nanhaiensis]|uniref:DUF3772 domain-containing protein n=1 Tax=Pseudooceanicola nanhaiensis TaxID=375761 RepID=UPI001CD2F6A7|nr:DUF3772 domain-containing protein [Pseudooceanicola nanhaiensis]MCA0921508.1 DUF3772 domain-containing protein [Pseudooceanicola nanhaiensis]
MSPARRSVLPRALRSCLLILLLALMGAGAGVLSPFHPTAVQAQDGESGDGALNYADWDKVAERAETAIEDNAATSSTMSDLRAELVSWRDHFQGAEQINASTITSVQAQLDALGAPPETGEEAPEIAQQREEITARLTELRAPGTAAGVAYSRADALIREIDRILRERQANQLLELGPTPLNPGNWPTAAESLTGSFMGLVAEVQSNWRRAGSESLRGSLPAVLLSLALAGFVLLRGRSWVERWSDKVRDRNRTAERWLLGLVISLGQIILPAAGLGLILVASFMSGLVGPQGEALLGAAFKGGVNFFIIFWLGTQMFPKSDVTDPPLRLSRPQRLEGRFYAVFLGLLLFVYELLVAAGAYADWSAEARNVIFFPLLLAAGPVLYRLGQLLMAHARSEQDPSESIGFLMQLVLLLGRFTIAIAVLGPLAGAIGYFAMADALVMPMIRSLALLALIVVVQRIVVEIYVLITRNRAHVDEALTPVLAAALLVLGSLPVFALIWGARTTDLAELWSQFMQGFSLGDTTISPSNFLTFVIVFAIGLGLTRLSQGALGTTILPKTKLDAGGQRAFVTGLGYVGIFLAAIIAITAAGINLSALAYVAGALSVGIGFGMQNIVQNFVSGIILLVERPISEGDWIQVNGQMGIVKSISVRSTRIETFDRTDVIVPNADLISGTVTNWTRGNNIGRVILTVGVAYGTNTRRVEEILLEIGKSHPMVLDNPAPFVYFKGFGESSLDFEVRLIIRDVLWGLPIQTELNHTIAERFAEEGIEIPFAQRDLWIRNPEKLHPAPTSGGSGPAQPDPAPAAQGPEKRDAVDKLPDAAQHMTSDDIGTDDGGGEDR